MMLKAKIITGLFERLKYFNRRPFFGFVQGHSHITDSQVQEMYKLIDSPSSEYTSKFEKEFSSYLGIKNATSFASGRMGFYALLQALKIKSGDEIILTGSTCAVMANAVIRTGAMPIYADISPETFGTCPESIKKLITHNTKVIVAQHSFGIPCDIKEIVKIALEKDIFLVEDCALSLGSTVDGTKVGVFGDASLFSFDHTKPISTMLGGMICTNFDLHQTLKKTQDSSSELPLKKRKLLFKRFRVERRNCNPMNFGQFQLIDLVETKFRAIFDLETPFLTDDSTSEINQASSYSYPAKMPEFIAYLGLIELKRWAKVKVERQTIMKNFINVLQSYGFGSEIGSIYDKAGIDITPLRLVWRSDNGFELRDRMKDFLQVKQSWFMRSIVDTNEPLENFHYISGSCPVSETLPKTVINLPTSLSIGEADTFINKLSVLDRQPKD